MTAPALEVQRFGWALLLGAGLGLIYGFLRYFRPRGLGDLVFLGATFAAWVYLGFGICGGDLRFGYSMGLLAGGLLWEFTAGRLLRPVFRGFWRGIGRILGLLVWPLKKFCKIFKKFCKFLLAGAKKWVTILFRKIRPFGRRNGGVTHGSRKDSHSPVLSQEQSADQGGSAGSRRIVYGGGGRTECLH